MVEMIKVVGRWCLARLILRFRSRTHESLWVWGQACLQSSFQDRNPVSCLEKDHNGNNNSKKKSKKNKPKKEMIKVIKPGTRRLSLILWVHLKSMTHLKSFPIKIRVKAVFTNSSTGFITHWLHRWKKIQ